MQQNKDNLRTQLVDLIKYLGKHIKVNKVVLVRQAYYDNALSFESATLSDIIENTKRYKQKEVTLCIDSAYRVQIKALCKETDEEYFERLCRHIPEYILDIRDYNEYVRLKLKYEGRT